MKIKQIKKKIVVYPEKGIDRSGTARSAITNFQGILCFFSVSKIWLQREVVYVARRVRVFSILPVCACAFSFPRESLTHCASSEMCVL